jgi:hypothetical protein
MDNKDKIIKEMAKIIGHCYCDKECQNKCAYCDISSLNEAKKLYENGFRKLPEDSVVLSKEELQEIIVKAKVKEREKISELKKEIKELNKLLLAEKEGSFWDGVNEGILKGSKETAEKIFEELVGHTFEDDGWTWTVSKEDIQWLAEKYKVEIKE